MFEALHNAGISSEDAQALRRISRTLQRWFELECGDSNRYFSWWIERDGDEPDSKPYMVRHNNLAPSGTKPSRLPVADRETGARKRLAKIMARYPSLRSYVQTDPRGAALYILRPGDVPEGGDPSAYYTRGLCVY